MRPHSPFLTGCLLLALLAAVGTALPAQSPGFTRASAAPTAPSTPGMSVEEIMDRSLESSERNMRIAEDYAWRETRVFRRLDKHGAVKDQDSKTYDVTMIEGKEYERLVMEDGEPLPPEKERKEQEKLDKEVAKLQNESASDRAKRLKKDRQEKEEREEMFRAIPKAFDIRFEGEEQVEGRPAWILHATPRKGYKPTSRQTNWLTKMGGRIWVDKQSFIWLKAEVETLETLSFGLVLARVGKGSTMQFEQQLVNGEVWVPRRTEVHFDARLGLVAKLRGVAEVMYSNYQKFSADSTIVSTEIADSSQ
ncbi:MAG: hypothetical protein MUF01_13960 [Bryobacterales bacterium]|jgi:hypothetical protein|nr:hypothetical protein [Bryobacterales bacterium]